MNFDGSSDDFVRDFIPFGETRPLRAGFFKIRMGPSSKLGPYPLQSQALRPGFTQNSTPCSVCADSSKLLVSLAITSFFIIHLSFRSKTQLLCISLQLCQSLIFSPPNRF